MANSGIRIEGEFIKWRKLNNRALQQAFGDVGDFVKEKQRRLVLTHGGSIGAKWPELTEVTKGWKERTGLPSEILQGRSGRLMRAVQNPEMNLVTNDGEGRFDISIGGGRFSREGISYARLVHEGWTQNVKSHRQRRWMTWNLFMIGLNIGDSFGTPPRRLVGFTSAELTERTKLALFESMGLGRIQRGFRLFEKRINRILS